MSRPVWRLLDTGVRTAAENMALDEVILRAREAGVVPNTLRFLQFSPRAVLVGYHQDVDLEVRREYCESHGVEINRRLTGGGALYWDESQLGWEIFAGKGSEGLPSRAAEIYRRLAQGTILALNSLGVAASFRPHNDIEVGGRKISGTGGTEWGQSFLFQGTLLTDFDVDGMLRSLRLPAEKLRDKDVNSFRERVTCLREELGTVPAAKDLKASLAQGFAEILGVDLIPGELTDWESERLEKRRSYFASADWVRLIRKPPTSQTQLTAIHKAPGGLVRVALAVDRPAEKILSAFITGDFFAYPSRLILDLEAALKFSAAEGAAVAERVREFFAGRAYEIPGVGPEDFVTALQAALGKLSLGRYGFSLDESNHLFAVGGEPEALGSPQAMLLPYCAKLTSCGYRNEDDCVECGLCSVGEAYRLGREAGLKVVSINNYEELEATLEGLTAEGISSFVGSCCEAFFSKHQADFERLGLPGVLVDVRNTTCYELGEERAAHEGRYERETELDLGLLEKALAFLRRSERDAQVL